MSGNFRNKFSQCYRKFLDIWATALSADLFIFITACILLLSMFVRPNLFTLLALVCLFIWAIMF